jgi:hypothetical protein
MILSEDLKDTRNFKLIILNDIEKRLINLEITIEALKADINRERKRLNKLKGDIVLTG